jgi:hypothetical protein
MTTLKNKYDRIIQQKCTFLTAIVTPKYEPNVRFESRNIFSLVILTNV